jgi:hypothetical protein
MISQRGGQCTAAWPVSRIPQYHVHSRCCSRSRIDSSGSGSGSGGGNSGSGIHGSSRWRRRRRRGSASVASRPTKQATRLRTASPPSNTQRCPMKWAIVEMSSSREDSSRQLITLGCATRDYARCPLNLTPAHTSMGKQRSTHSTQASTASRLAAARTHLGGARPRSRPGPRW